MRFGVSILLCIVLCSVSLGGQSRITSNPFQEIIRKTSIKKGDIVVIAFLIPGECVKCNLTLSSAFIWIKEKMVKRKAKFVGFISCHRQIELKEHAPHFPMFDLLLMDDGDIRQQMGIASTARAVVCDHSGKVLGVVSYEEYFGDIQAAFKRILKIK